MSNEMTNYETESVKHILMNVIGEALLKADASFLFGVSFRDVVDKYSPLLRRKTPDILVIEKELYELKEIVTEINRTQPFQGSLYDYVMQKIDQLEYDICKDPENVLA